jgi:diguanylate cyclase (GGDEF)-like protein
MAKARVSAKATIRPQVDGPVATGPALAEPAASPGAALRTALLESRQLWRDLVMLTADFAFETDAWGRFVFIAPDPVLGWSASALLGQRAEVLLSDGGASGRYNPFRPATQVRRRRTWLRRAGGEPACLSFAAAPLLDDEGRIIGARGLGQDVTEQDGWDAAVAAALRRQEVLDHILWRMRQEVMAPHMMQVALESLSQGMGAGGAALLDVQEEGEPVTLHQTGPVNPAVLETAATLMKETGREPAQATTANGALVLVCPCQTRFGAQAGLILWRPAGALAWDAEHHVLASSATGLVSVILEQESVQREMLRQARTDPLTGLLNRRAFMDEMARRIDRLEREGLCGTLMFVDLDHFKELNDRRGHDAGDEALCIIAALLRSTVRPADLVARLGGDEFALWLDEADHLTAAERAESLRVEGPNLLSHLTDGFSPALTMSIGIATRWPGWMRTSSH